MKSNPSPFYSSTKSISQSLYQWNDSESHFLNLHPLFNLLPLELNNLQKDNPLLLQNIVRKVFPISTVSNSTTFDTVLEELAQQCLEVVSLQCHNGDKRAAEGVMNIISDLLRKWVWTPPFRRQYSSVFPQHAKYFYPHSLPWWMFDEFIGLSRDAFIIISCLLFQKSGLLGNHVIFDFLTHSAAQLTQIVSCDHDSLNPLKLVQSHEILCDSIPVFLCPFKEMLRTRLNRLPVYQQCDCSEGNNPFDLGNSILIFVSHAWRASKHPDPEGIDWYSVIESISELVTTIISALTVLSNCSIDLDALISKDSERNLKELRLEPNERTWFLNAVDQTRLINVELPRTGSLISSPFYPRMVQLCIQLRPTLFIPFGTEKDFSNVLSSWCSSVIDHIFIWIDYACLPQNVPHLGLYRSTEETIAFRKVLDQMGVLQDAMFTVICNSPIANLVSSTEKVSPENVNPISFINRAWCIAELLNADVTVSYTGNNEDEMDALQRHYMKCSSFRLLLDYRYSNPQQLLSSLNLSITNRKEDSRTVCEILWLAMRKTARKEDDWHRIYLFKCLSPEQCSVTDVPTILTSRSFSVEKSNWLDWSEIEDDFNDDFYSRHDWMDLLLVEGNLQEAFLWLRQLTFSADSESSTNWSDRVNIINAALNSVQSEANLQTDGIVLNIVWSVNESNTVKIPWCNEIFGILALLEDITEFNIDHPNKDQYGTKVLVRIRLCTKYTSDLLHTKLLSASSSNSEKTQYQSQSLFQEALLFYLSERNVQNNGSKWIIQWNAEDFKSKEYILCTSLNVNC